MSDDLIDRLRSYRSFDEWGDVQHAVCDEAADELDRLRAALTDERAHADALMEALDAIADLPAGKAEAVATAKRARHIAICARRQG